MSGLSLGIVVVNGCCTASASLAIVAVLAIYPLLAMPVPVDAQGWVRDAGLCFLPLFLPLLVAFGVSALQLAFRGAPGATAQNGVAVAVWVVLVAIGATLGCFA